MGTRPRFRPAVAVWPVFTDDGMLRSIRYTLGWMIIVPAFAVGIGRATYGRLERTVYESIVPELPATVSAIQIDLSSHGLAGDGPHQLMAAKAVVEQCGRIAEVGAYTL